MNGETRTSPKIARKPQARSRSLHDAILRIAATYDRMSVRQLYYQLVAHRVIEKTEQSYKRVCNAAVQRVALNPDQIAAYGLPTRPGKWTDSRHAKFAATYGDACVELDALPPDVLTHLVHEHILTTINRDAWEHAQSVEALERETFASIASIGWEPGAAYHLPDSDGAR